MTVDKKAIGGVSQSQQGKVNIGFTEWRRGVTDSQRRVSREGRLRRRGQWTVARGQGAEELSHGDFKVFGIRDLGAGAAVLPVAAPSFTVQGWRLGGCAAGRCAAGTVPWTL